MGYLREIPSGAKQIHVILLLYVYTFASIRFLPFFYGVKMQGVVVMVDFYYYL